LILVTRAAATVWEVKRSASGVLANLEKKTAFVNHSWFHIMDPDWGSSPSSCRASAGWRPGHL
jgi:hypothetical protein